MTKFYILFCLLTVHFMLSLNAEGSRDSRGPGLPVQSLPPGIIEGQAVSSDGTAVAHAVVYARPQVSGSSATSGITDENGRFRLLNLPAGEYLISALKEESGYSDTVLRFHWSEPDDKVTTKVSVRSNEIVSGVVVRLGPESGRLRIKVIDADTKRSIREAFVEIKEKRTLTRAMLGPTELNGTFRFLIPPSNAFSIQVSATGYRTGYYPDKGSSGAPWIQIESGSEKDIVAPLLKIEAARNVPVSASSLTNCGKTVEGVKLCAELEKQRVRQGEPIILKLEITNTSDKELGLDLVFPEFDYRLEIIDQAGRRVPMSGFAKSKIARIMHSGFQFLDPGETRSDSFEVSKWYDVRAAGAYSVTAKRFVSRLDGVGTPIATSNTLKFVLLKLVIQAIGVVR